MRKIWMIAGTTEFCDNKEILKSERTRLNKEAGVDELTTEPATWPYKLTKGPEHPLVSPYFTEIRIGEQFNYKGDFFKKTDITTAQRISSDGVVGLTKVPFTSPIQVHKAI